MAKFERILDRFPSFCAAGSASSLLHQLVRELARPIDELDTHLLRIQRSHRLLVAEDTRDVIRLAAAIGLAASDLGDVVGDASLTTSQQLDMLRERIQRVARLSLEGLGTPWAVLEGVATFLDARIVPGRDTAGTGALPVTRVDPDGFSHRATLEMSRAAGAPTVPLYLHEHPLQRRTVELAERYPMHHWATESATPVPRSIRFVIAGIGERTVLPTIFCPMSGEAIQFFGILPANETLIIDAADGATLSGRAADDWIVYSRGGSHGFSRWDESDVVLEQRDAIAPFHGTPTDLAADAYPSRKPVPMPPPGRAEWYFTVQFAVCDASLWDYAVLDVPSEPIGRYDGDVAFDGAVFDFEASAGVGMAWSERLSCAFKLALPARLPPRAGEHTSSPAPAAWAAPDVGRIAGLVRRFKPAGVRAYVDLARDAWILGQSTVRDGAARGGEGVDHLATRVQHPFADLFVAPDA